MKIAPAPVAITQNGSRVFYGWIVIFLAVFAVAVTNGLSIGGIPVFYRSFISEFGWSRTTIATAGTMLFYARGLAGAVARPYVGQHRPNAGFCRPGPLTCAATALRPLLPP